MNNADKIKEACKRCYFDGHINVDCIYKIQIELGSGIYEHGDKKMTFLIFFGMNDKSTIRGELSSVLGLVLQL